MPARRLSVLSGHFLAPAPVAANAINNTTRTGSWKDQSQLGGIQQALPKVPTGPVRGIANRITVEPLPDRTFGAVIRGVSLANDDLDDPEAWEKVYQAFLKHELLVFPDQHGLTKDKQGAFAERFAPLKHHLTITNLKPDGSIRKEPDTRTTGFHAKWEGLKPGNNPLGQRGTEGWHTDVSFTPVSVTTGQLCAGEGAIVPTEEGETEFCDMAGAYDALDDTMKAKIQDMVTYHSANYGVMRRTGPPPGEDNFKPTPPSYPVPFHDDAYCRPLVKIHPITKRKTLLPTAFCFGIPGLSREESTKLLDYLMDFAAQAPRLYKHKWAMGDLVIWDERATFHRSRPYAPDMPRRLFGVRTIGGIESEGALPGPEAIKVHQETGGLGGVGVEAPDGARALAEELAAMRKEKPWLDITKPNQRAGW